MSASSIQIYIDLFVNGCLGDMLYCHNGTHTLNTWKAIYPNGLTISKYNFIWGAAMAFYLGSVQARLGNLIWLIEMEFRVWNCRVDLLPPPFYARRGSIVMSLAGRLSASRLCRGSDFGPFLCWGFISDQWLTRDARLI